MSSYRQEKFCPDLMPMVYPGRYFRCSLRGLCRARVDTPTADRDGVSLDLHYLGVYLLGDSFHYRNLPAVSDGRNSFSDCRGSALCLDAFERRSTSNTG